MDTLLHIGYRTQPAVIIWRSPGDFILGLDFVENAYFVEVELIKTAASGNPGVKAIAITTDGS